MGKPLSIDLRGRALAAVDAGISRRAAAGRFGVSVSSVIRWDAQRRATGSFEPKPQGGDMRSRRIEARHADVMAAFEEARDQSLEVLRVRLAVRGVAASIALSLLCALSPENWAALFWKAGYGRTAGRGAEER